MIIRITALIILSFFFIMGFMPDDPKKMSKVNVNDYYQYISVNNVLMWVANNGDGSHDPFTQGSGFYWPDKIKSAIFEDGLVFGARVGEEIRVNGNTHRQGLQAGKIINGIPDNPEKEKYRVYKITKGWESLPPGAERSAREKDYLEWPIEDGAPFVDVNEDGKPSPGIDKPQCLGDETLWYVANDMDSLRSKGTYGMNPMGLEFQTTVFGYKKFNTFGDVVFKKYKVINKGDHNLQDMYLGIWSDPDLGDAADDFVGCDTLLDIGYVYNGDNLDGNGTGQSYGANPPAVGYTILQGPVIHSSISDSAKFGNEWRKGYRNLPMTAFIKIDKDRFIDPPQGIPLGSDLFYNYLIGKNWDGSDIISPVSNQVTKFTVSGDPVSGTGWNEDIPPYDRRFIMSSGPFNLAPGDTQEIVYAIHLARGYNYLNSVTQLKNQSSILRNWYKSDLKSVNPPDKPILNYTPQPEGIVLWWEKNSEDYIMPDPTIPDTIKININENIISVAAPDKMYNFEGYRIWQYRNAAGEDPVLVAVIDKKNNIKEIHEYPYEFINGQIPVSPILQSPDEGLSQYHIITRDEYTKGALRNGSNYYFGITAYGYSKFSEPPVLESEANIIEAIPGILPIDLDNQYSAGSNITFKHDSGFADGEIFAKVIIPEKLNGHTYEVSFSGGSNDLLYYLIDRTTNDTLITEAVPGSEDTIYSKLVDGFVLVIINEGLFNLGNSTQKIRSIEEIKGPGGVEIKPVNVYNSNNSTGKWSINSVSDNLQTVNLNNTVGFDDYEIRFTGSGSEYYNTGYSDIWILDLDPKAEGKVPFEIWRMPAISSELPERLIIKIYDANRDSLWSVSNEGYEPFYAFIPLIPYPDTLPSRSVFQLGARTLNRYRIGNIVFKGEIPDMGTVIKIKSWKPLTSVDKFTAKSTVPVINNQLAKQNINNITIFPNPYYGTLETAGSYPSFVRFTNLPQKAVIRIFSLSGVFITKLEKEGDGQYIDWNLRNDDNHLIGSGIYLAYIELPGIGTRIMKIAVVL
jgi:hypothetical protein